MNQDAKLPLNKKWSFLKNNLLNGPYTDQELVKVFKEKKIDQNDLILNAEDHKWYSLEELNDLGFNIQKQATLSHDKEPLIVNESMVVIEPIKENHMSEDEVRRHNEILKSQPQIVVPPPSEIKTRPSILFKDMNIASEGQSSNFDKDKMTLKQQLESKKKYVIFSSIGVLVFVLLFVLRYQKNDITTAATFEEQVPLDENALDQNQSQRADQQKNIESEHQTQTEKKLKANQEQSVGEVNGLAAQSDQVQDSINNQKNQNDARSLSVERKAKYVIYIDRHRKLTEEIKIQVDVLHLRFGNNVRQKIKVSKYWDKYYTEWLNLSDRVQAEIDLSVADSKDDADLSLILTKFTNLFNTVRTYADILNGNLRQFFTTQKLSEDKEIQMDAFKEKINSLINEVEIKLKELEKKTID